MKDIRESASTGGHGRWLVASFVLFVPTAPVIAQEPDPRGAQLQVDDNAAVLIPEPMVFDLVRGLGAEQWEAEANVLGVFPLRGTDPRGVEWAPEIEVAVADGFALEFELPFEDTHLEGVKFAAQYTFGAAFERHFIHGAQGIAARFRDDGVWEATLLYLAGVRFDETWSVLAMLGVRTWFNSPSAETRPIINVSVFADVSHAVTVGLESDYEGPVLGASGLRLMPQVHVEMGERLMVQAGVGVLRIGGETLPEASARLIMEL